MIITLAPDQPKPRLDGKMTSRSARVAPAFICTIALGMLDPTDGGWIIEVSCDET
jgi:hypothetical protein